MARAAEPAQIPLFDSLSHPTLSGGWHGRHLDASFDGLARALESNGCVAACAVGMHGIEGYEHEAFIAACRPHPALVPIAGFAPGPDDPDEELAHIRALGFAGIKIHPRYSKLSLDDPALAASLRAAGRVGLPVLLCTYHHDTLARYPTQDPFYATVALLQAAPDTKVVLVHGGDVGLRRYAELVRFNENLLLDLSFTLLAYEGSSLDADIGFLFRARDRRICVGSDHPEFDHGALRRRFETFATGLSPEKAENIAYRNLEAFLGIRLPMP
jgi:predicted TIM-barrel fold metal-dependent hydrolase